MTIKVGAIKTFDHSQCKTLKNIVKYSRTFSQRRQEIDIFGEKSALLCILYKYILYSAIQMEFKGKQ